MKSQHHKAAALYPDALVMIHDSPDMFAIFVSTTASDRWRETLETDRESAYQREARRVGANRIIFVAECDLERILYQAVVL